MPSDADAVEIRVVACLVEKQRTTPDNYPLSLNALRLACNQSTNRNPVVDYDEATVSDALRRTALRGWTRLASGAGSRARKYRHLLPEALGVDGGELAALAVLMLRGAQTPGELKGRTERLQGFADLAAVHEVLDRLIERGYVVRHPRRPGQKEDRYEQVLGGGEAEPVAAPPAPAPTAPAPSPLGPQDGPADRVSATGPGTGEGADRGPGAAPAADRESGAAPAADRESAAGPRDDRGPGIGADADGVSDTGPSADRTAGAGPSADRTADDEDFLSIAAAPTPAEAADEVARLDRLEAELLELKGEIARLREALGD